MSKSDVSINDVSLRDGIQNEKKVISVETKLRIVQELIAAGVKNLQVASFVNPNKVPQMRDIETFIDSLPHAYGSPIYSGLVLNERGLDRLKATPLTQVDLSLSCSDRHGKKNTGLSLDEAKAQVLRMVSSAKQAGLFVRTGLQCAFGFNDVESVRSESVVQLCRELGEAGCDILSIADSTGQAIPSEVKTLVLKIQDVTDRPLILHLHDTRGLGMANLLSAYEAGVRHFDASLGGVGGCPFIPGAAGNIASEDVVQLMNRMGVQTGVSLAHLVSAAAILEAALDYSLPGRVYQLLKKQRPNAFPEPKENRGVAQWA